jgi:hypothetical protein
LTDKAKPLAGSQARQAALFGHLSHFRSFKFTRRK